MVLALPLALLLGGAGAATAWLTFKPTFVAEAWVRIEDRRPYVAFPSQDESRRFVQTQVEMIRSPVVVSQCLSQPEIAQLPELKNELDPLAWVSKRLSITVIAESELFRVKFSGPNPESAAKIANAVVDAYLDRHERDARQETQRVIDVLEVEQNKRVRDIQRMQENLRTLAKQVTGKDILSFRRTNDATTESPLTALESRLTMVEVERTVLEAEHGAAQSILQDDSDQKVEVDERALDHAVSNDPGVVALNSDLAQLRLAVHDYEEVSKRPDQLEAVKRFKKRMASVQADLEKRKVEAREIYAREFEKLAVVDRRVDANGLGTKLQGLRMQERLLREKLDAQRVEMEKSGDQVINLEFACSELERAEDVFRRIAERVTALQTEQKASARVSFWSRATPPSAPTITTTRFVAGIGGMLFVLPFALAFMWEIRIRRVFNADQVREDTRLPVLGEITSMPARTRLVGSSGRVEQDRATFDESIAHMRTALMLSDDMSDLRVIAVSSAVSGEGKTSIAVQLAANLAETSGEPTLLVDADVRDPDVHDTFGIPLEPGLAGLLIGQITLDEAIKTCWDHRVQVLSAGRTTITPHALFGNGSFYSVLEKLRSEYRYVVIDCPPLLSASEALVIAKAADGCFCAPCETLVVQVKFARPATG